MDRGGRRAKNQRKDTEEIPTAARHTVADAEEPYQRDSGQRQKDKILADATARQKLEPNAFRAKELGYKTRMGRGEIR